MIGLREPGAEPLPGYRLLEPIGTGGFGEVWKCLAPGGIQKAIKFVFGNLQSLDDDNRAQQELQALEHIKQVRHPFLLSIEQIQVVDGELVIVMELADHNLHDAWLACQQRGLPGIPREQLIRYLDDAAAGLDYLIEKHGLQHLDVKPRNLFVVADRVKVADFGLVKSLERSSVSGLMGGVTPLYSAPETFINKISKHSDQYSLAIVYMELLTGRRPFNGKNIRQLALQHMSEPPDLSPLPELDRPIIARALAKDPEARYPSCTAMVRALAAAGHQPTVVDLSLTAVPAGSTPAGVAPVGVTPAGPTPAGVAPAGSVPPAIVANMGSRVSVAEMSLPTPAAGDLAVAANGQAGSRTPGSTAVAVEDSVTRQTVPLVESGVLRPTILIGIGSFGRRALQEVRRRLTDRLGELSQIPAFRFLYVDCDPEALSKALAAPAECMLHSEEVFITPLQPLTPQRRRQMDALLEWLPQDILYNIPRNRAVGGNRALGRLAFCDNYLRFVSRLRRELAIATHPESLAQTVAQSGLQVRDHHPQVIILSSLAGGSGGMLLDLGHAVRRVLDRHHSPQAVVLAFAYIGAPTDPTTSDHELANIYAALTELNHYADPEMVFKANYGGLDGPYIEARGLPFAATYLLSLEERSSAAFRRCLHRLATYITHELTTPFGATIQLQRQRPRDLGRTAFRSFGACSVWYPRGLLLRQAAQRLCGQLLQQWSQLLPPHSPLVTPLVQRITGDPRLQGEAIGREIWQLAARQSEEGRRNLEQLGHAQAELAAAVAASRPQDMAATAQQLWEQWDGWVRLRRDHLARSPARPSLLERLLEHAARSYAEAWANECLVVLEPLEHRCGPRLGALAAAWQTLAEWCEQMHQQVEQKRAEMSRDGRQVLADAEAALAACRDDRRGFGLFGGWWHRAWRHYVEQLQELVQRRIEEELAQAAGVFYRTLRTKAEEQLRELDRCRSRLQQVFQGLNQGVSGGQSSGDTPMLTPETARSADEVAVVHIMLPHGESRIEAAVTRFVSQLPPDTPQRLEEALEKLVLAPRGGLLALCRLHADLHPLLVVPMIDQAAAFLSPLLSYEDVTQLHIEAATHDPRAADAHLQHYHRLAAPPLGSDGREELTVLVVPGRAGYEGFCQHLRALFPQAVVVEVRGCPSDLLFCREQHALRHEDLATIAAACLPAYQQACQDVLTHPHCRHDVTAWLPLWE